MMGRTMSTQEKSAKKPGRRTPSGELRVALVDAAEAVLLRDGPGGVTVRAVAAEAGVAPMGVYNRFGSKEGLIQAILVRGFQGLQAAVEADDQTDPRGRLRASGERYRRFALDHPRHYELMFGSHQLSEYSPELLECAGGAFEALVGHVATAMAAGVLGAGDPRGFAQQVWCMVHGAVSLELGGHLFTDPEENYRQLLDLILRGPDFSPGPPAV